MVCCAVCTRPERDEIDRAILAGVSERKIAGDYGISRGAVIRHKPHIGEALIKAKEIKEVARADTLLDEVRSLKQRAETGLSCVERVLSNLEAGDGDVRAICDAVRTANGSIREIRGTLELLAKIAGDIPPEGSTIINIMMNPEWTRIQNVVLQVLEPYPDAKILLAERLAEVSDVH